MPDYYSGMGSKEYWQERAFDKDMALKKGEDELLKELSKYNKEAFLDIRRELNDFYNKYAINNNLTFNQAKRLLTPIELEDYNESMAIFKEMYSNSHNPFILEEINKLNARINVTRKMALLDKINIELIKYSDKVQLTFEDYLSGLYIREFEEVLKDLNYGIKPVINTEAIKEIIEYPYAGAMYSDRIWRNKNILLNWINDDLTKALIKGDSIQRMAANLKYGSDTATYQSERLVRTETNYVMTQGHLNGYKEAGIDQYEILAHIDSRTSSICKKKDGKIINISEGGNVGEDLPPFHPNCRSTIIPVFKD